MKKSMVSFARDPEKMFSVRLTKLMPVLIPILIKMMNMSVRFINFVQALMPSILRNIEGPPQLWIFKQIENVVQQRLNSQNKRIDLLQLMLDSSTKEEIKVNYQVFGKYVVGRQNFVDRQLVDKFLSKTFCRHSTSSTQHFVDEHFVENFSSTKHFVDTALGRHSTSSTEHFVDTALRRQNTSSTQHFVDTALRRHTISSTDHFIDRIRRSMDDYNRILLVL